MIDEWKARCLIVSEALVNCLDGVYDEELLAMTGLPESERAKIKE